MSDRDQPELWEPTDNELAPRERKCGRCTEPFWSVPHRGRPTFIPLFCEPCGAWHAEKRQRNEQRHVERERARLATLGSLEDLADVLVKRSKRGRKKV